MAENSGIEWTHHTWNPWVGCTKISPACDHCYAEDWSKRAGRDVWGPHADRQRTKTQGNPIKWNKRLEGSGERERVFVASLADVFDNHKSIQQVWRDEMWRTIRECPNLDFLLLTKRPQNIKRYLPADWGDGYPNVLLGTTVENQTEADRRIPELLAAPAVGRFLSCEPLLEEINLTRVNVLRPSFGTEQWTDCLLGASHTWQEERQGGWGGVAPGKICWVICGGESGPGARPMHPKWARSLRDQCKAAKVPFFFKQWGEWAPVAVTLSDDPTEETGAYPLPGCSDPKSHSNKQPCLFHHNDEWLQWPYLPDGEFIGVRRVGKKGAGAHLDGVLHREFPADWGRL